MTADTTSLWPNLSDDELRNIAKGAKGPQRRSIEVELERRREHYGTTPRGGAVAVPSLDMIAGDLEYLDQLASAIPVPGVFRERQEPGGAMLDLALWAERARVSAEEHARAGPLSARASWGRVANILREWLRETDYGDLPLPPEAQHTLAQPLCEALVRDHTDDRDTWTIERVTQRFTTAATPTWAVFLDWLLRVATHGRPNRTGGTYRPAPFDPSEEATATPRPDLFGRLRAQLGIPQGKERRHG
jgi:hypothetical protein